MGYNVAAELFAEWAVGLGIIALRLYARWKVGKGRFYWDDLFLGFAVVRSPSILQLPFGVLMVVTRSSGQCTQYSYISALVCPGFSLDHDRDHTSHCLLVQMSMAPTSA